MNRQQTYGIAAISVGLWMSDVAILLDSALVLLPSAAMIVAGAIYLAISSKKVIKI